MIISAFVYIIYKNTIQRLNVNDIFYPLLLTAAAGLAGCIGFFAIFIPSKNIQKLLSAALGFSAGVMITVSFSDLLPEAQTMLEGTYSQRAAAAITLLFLVLGVIFALFIDRFVPHETGDNASSHEHRDLLRVGVVSALAMMLHNFPVGIATFLAGYSDMSLGFSIAIAIALHNIPEGLAIALPIYYSTKSVSKSFLFVLLSAVAEPLGGLCAYLFLSPFINAIVLGAIFAVIAGIMLYISFEELLPSSRKYGYNSITLFSVLGGICVIFISTAI